MRGHSRQEPRPTGKPVADQFGKNLRRYRKQVGMSQEALGFGSGLHRTEIGLLERGLRTPRIDTMIKLSSSLGIDAGELLTGISWEPGDYRRGGFRVAQPRAEAESWNKRATAVTPTSRPQ